MSNDDFWVNDLSDDQVKAYAQITKAYFGVERTRPVNIVKCLERGAVKTVRGTKKLVYEVVLDAEMGRDDARTELVNDLIIISVRKSVDDKARWGDGRSRMTLAHELAHAVLHPGATKFRRVGAEGQTDGGRIPAYRSAEHQAKVFASSFLIHEDQLQNIKSSEELSEEFIISLEAARIAFQHVIEKRDKAINAEKFMKLAQEFKQSTKQEKAYISKYLSEHCTCGAQKMIPIGCKYLCEACGTVSDRFQDGDQQN